MFEQPRIPSGSLLHPTILLGLDGATFTVLDALMAEGHMPCLRAFLDEGIRAELLSTPVPLTPPAWTTVVTGRQPGSHGIFDFIWAEQRNGDVYFTLNNFRDVQVETIWSIVSRQGGTITSINYPFMVPAPPVNGRIVPGLVSWKHLARGVHPPELYHRIKSLPGFSPKEVAWDFEREKKAAKEVPRDETEEWVEFHTRRERHWYQIFDYLQRSGPSDLTAILIDGVDKLQHVCWRQLDPAYGESLGSGFDRRVRSLSLKYFRELDQFIGRVMEAARNDARIFIASDHGFGPTRKVFRVNQWLHEKGYLTWRSTASLDEAEQQKVERLVNGHFVYLDWDRTTAYAQSAATNGIHIRVASRPGDPGVRREEFESFRNRLMDELLAIRDPETGAPIVTAVMKREDAFPGENNERCPDLTLTLHDHGFISTLNKTPVFFDRPEIVGTHRPEGVFLARGPGIPKGQSLGEQSIVDVAPTLLYSLGLPIPSDFEGSVIEESFEKAHLAAHPIRMGAPTEPPGSYASKQEATSAEEDEIVMDRLRALGYVE